ncbi:MAG: hypothetical protein LBE48_06450 [Methanomassiliicoccaceae archaeon]|jgi:predicted GNAT family N-acyltransferase|nr:hypothetical protein [Methanomassiliicoccaceae archaeon]
MTIRTHQLSELIKEMNKKELSSFLSRFKCSRSTDSERFLREVSVMHDKKDISRTHLIVDSEEDKILGYFTLALKCLSLNECDLSKSTVELMNLNEGVAQAYLIGQLAKADDAASGLGKRMLDEALKAFIDGKRKFGCRMVRLDCKDELIDYYVSYGFQHIRRNHEKDLNQMAIFI